MAISSLDVLGSIPETIQSLYNAIQSVSCIFFYLNRFHEQSSFDQLTIPAIQPAMWISVESEILTQQLIILATNAIFTIHKCLGNIH